MSDRGRSAAVGAAGLLFLVGLGYFMALFLGGTFRPGYETTAHFDRAGQLLRGGSDVKIRGVLVGEVARVEVSEHDDAVVTMRIFPGHEIPRNVGAAIRAKTLFGEKFVELQIPDDPAPELLSPGDAIPRERTIDPFEVETVLEQAMPVLGAIDPEGLAGALSAVAGGLSGNVDALRRATVQGERALSETARTLPELERNLQHLRDFAAALDASDQHLLDAMRDLERAGDVLARRPAAFRATLASLSDLTGDVADIVTAREDDLAVLAAQGSPILETVAARADELPHLVEMLDSFLGVWVLDLSEGPYWRIFLDSEEAFESPYPPGTEPQPRDAVSRVELLSVLLGEDGPGSAADIVLAPVPDEDLAEVVRRLEESLEQPIDGEVRP